MCVTRTIIRACLVCKTVACFPFPTKLVLFTVMMSNKDCTANAGELGKSKQSSLAASADLALVILPILPLELRERIYHYILPPTLTSLNPLPPFLGLNLTADLFTTSCILTRPFVQTPASFTCAADVFQSTMLTSRRTFRDTSPGFPAYKGTKLFVD